MAFPRDSGSSAFGQVSEDNHLGGVDRPVGNHDRCPPGSRLPTFASALFGRGWELDEIDRRLGSARLVTVTGPGGIGKTRLAVEVAWRRAPGRACFVDLAPLRDERLVAERIAETFGLGELQGRDLAALLDAALAAETVLVLDNCEHLTSGCAAVAHELLAGCGAVRILATSQQRLGLPGEMAWVVPPLDLPGPGLRAPEDAQRGAAIQLFHDRAVAAKPDFDPGPGDVEAMVEICRRLDANPLAIELAAARVATLSLAEIAARLERRFQLLRSRPGATEGRYPSLAAALAWSHDLLSGPEKVLLRRLSVFAGTFGLAAVEDICSGGDIGPDDVLDVLSGVIAKSLVAADTSGPAARYRLAETVRLYAFQHLAAAGEDASVGERHARWCVRMVEAAGEGDKGAPTQQELAAEVDNVRAALEWCLNNERAELGLRLATAHMVAWRATGRVGEARDWLVRTLAISDGSAASLRARGIYHAAFAALLLGDLDLARRDAEASLAASAEAADPPSVVEETKGLLAVVSTFGGGSTGAEELERGLDEARRRNDFHLADALVGCGHARLFRGEPVAAEAHFEELVAVAGKTGNVGALATGLVGAGVTALGRGDCDRARDRLQEGIGVAAPGADVHTEVIGRIWVAELARLSGDSQGGRLQLEDCLSRARAMGSPYPVVLSLLSLGRADLDESATQDARCRFDEALTLARQAPLGHIQAAALEGLGEVARALDDSASAETLFASSLAAAEKCADQTATARATYQLAELARGRGNLDRAASLHHDALQRFHDVGVRPGIADSLDALGGVAVDGNDLVRGARLFGAAAALRDAGGWIRPVRRRARYESDVARLREQMGREVLEAAWAEGGELGLERAVAYASRGRARRARAKEGPDALTQAEREVVGMAVQGLTAKEIAGRLFISPRTVHSHLRRVYAKLGVTSRRELRQQASEVRPRE